MAETLTFTDPRTGEEIESTKLARGAAGLVYVPGAALRLAGICVLAGAPVLVLCAQFHFLTPLGAMLWTTAGALFGGLLIFGCEGYHRGASVTADYLHDVIALRQHRQRMAAPGIRSPVPDTALSLAPPPQPPVPGDAALSRSPAKGNSSEPPSEGSKT